MRNMDFEIMLKETMKKQPAYNIEKICIYSYMILKLKQIHGDMRDDDKFSNADCDEPMPPKRDTHHFDAIDIRPNPIVQLKENMLLDALSTPADLARSLRKKKGGATGTHMKSSLKKMLMKNMQGSQSFAITTPKFNARKPSTHADDLFNKQSTQMSAIGQSPQTMIEPSSPSIRSKRSKKLRLNSKRDDLSSDDEEGTQKRKSEMTIGDGKRSPTASVRSKMSRTLSKKLRQKAEEEEKRPKPQPITIEDTIKYNDSLTETSFIVLRNFVTKKDK